MRFPISDSRFPSLARLDSLSPRGMRLGLDAISAVCDRLGHPERDVPSLLIAGTNGKGSTAAALDALAAACGRRAGLYTSPHLVDVTERVRVGGQDLPAGSLDEALAVVFEAADREPSIPVTYFEAITAAAFRIFSEAELDVAILEVGLGGRFDATNVAPASAATVTSISLDHTAELGSALDGIAREKAGIFRRGRPALARAGTPLAVEALAEAARAAGAEWHDASVELSVDVRDVSLQAVAFDLATPRRRLAARSLLTGAHQAWNCALAVRTAELVPELFGEVSDAAVRQALDSVRWPGRLESVPVRGRTVVLDGCHNPEGAASLAAFLTDAGLAGRCPLVFAAMADKDVEGIAASLSASVASVALVPLANDRAASPGELARRVGAVFPDARAEASLESALARLLSEADAAPIIVAGSLYLVGEARRLLLGGGPF